MTDRVPDRVPYRVRLDSLPDELLRLVHEYLLPPPDRYCRVHDQAAPLRCTCKIAHAALAQVMNKMNTGGECISVQSLVGGHYEQLCAMLSLNRHVYACERLNNPETTCVVHDCCDQNDSCYDREEIIDALRVVSDQTLRGAKGLKYYFSSWPRLASFHELLRKAKVKLAPRYRPIATRVKGKIRVSWINERRPKYYFNAVE